MLASVEIKSRLCPSPPRETGRTVELDDARRTRWLNERGIRVLRFTNTEALREPDAVVDAIVAALA